MSTEEQQVLRVEPDVDVAQVLQRAQEETGADEQHQRDRDLHDEQRLAERASRPDDAAPGFLERELRFMPVPRSAGAMPNKMPVTR